MRLFRIIFCLFAFYFSLGVPFIVLAQGGSAVPTITSFSPTNGVTGTTVTITGTNFNTTAGNNTVYFGAIKATPSGSSTTSLTVNVPAGATSITPLIVQDNTTGLQASSITSLTPQFTVTNTPNLEAINANYNRTDFSVSTGPISVVISDFNGDGNADFASANSSSNNVSIRLGDGSGGFSGTTEVAVGSSPFSLAIGDFNGDGNADFAASSRGSRTVSIRLGDGLGGFSNSTDVSTPNSTNFVVTGDFNEDGNLDLAITNTNFRDNNNLSIRLGDGLGGFSGSTEVSLPTGDFSESVAIGDFNGDGKADLAVVNYFSNSVGIHLGNGLGGFGGATEISVGTNPRSVAIGDFNGDGDIDLAIANFGSSTLSIRLGDGLGGFGGTTEISASIPFSVATGDFNGDGNADVLSTYGLSLGDGLGDFGSSFFFGNPSSDNSLVVAVGDFNRDGNADFAVANNRSMSVSVYLYSPPPPTLGTYASLSAVTGENTTLTPSAAPTNTTSITAYTSSANATDFTGTLTADPATGVVTVTNAKQAGTYTVTVQATSSGGGTTTTTFELTIADPVVSVADFETKTDFGTDSGPVSVSIGDFNGDGNQDIAIANTDSDNVSILLGDGLGGYGSKTDFATGSAPRAISVGDFNGDGHQDLAVANSSSNNVSILLGDGVGSFGTKTDFGTGSNPFYVSLGDFNGDGNQDLSVANAGSTSVSILLGDGAGGFGTKTDFGTGSGPVSVTIGDFNGDGIQDLATANWLSTNVSILLGDGAGSFGAKTDFETGSSPYSVSLSDFNGDGNQDLVTANLSSNNVSILLGDGTGGFAEKSDFETGFGPLSVSVGDFNGDGNQDLATANFNSNNVSILLGDGAGGFGVKTDFGTGSAPRSVSVGDFNGDGKQDLAVANQSSDNVSILLGVVAAPTLGTYEALNVVTGENTSLTPSVAPTNTTSITAYTSSANATDFTGTLTVDPATGIVSVTNAKQAGSFTVTVQAANSGGTTTTTFDLTISDPVVSAGDFGPKTDFTTGSAPRSVSVGDFNGDGNQDLVVSNGNGNTVSILLGDGLGGYGAKTDFATGGAPRVVSVGDFNGDGNQDLAVANRNSGNVSILLGDGAGGFGAKTDFATGDFALSVSVGDFNGDGNQDLAVANAFSNNVSILLGDGTGSFGAKTEFVTGNSPRSVLVADFNRDGNQDLVVSNGFSSTVSILLGDGLGGFGAKTDFATGVGPRVVSVGDFNGDGNQDLAVANEGSANVSILLGDGAGAFGAKTDFGTGVFANSVSVGDFNGDGNQDLAVANFGSNNVSILLGDGAGSFGAKTDFDTGASPFSVSIGDFDGDGKQDLAVANFGSDNVSILLGVVAAPTLGTYEALNVVTGENTTLTPSAAPVGAVSMSAYTSSTNATDFTGTLTVDPATGIVSVTNAKQAGSFTVTVQATSSGGTTTTTFDLTISDPVVSAGNFGPKTDFTTGSAPRFVSVGDFNGDGNQDLVVSNGNGNTVSILLGDGLGGYGAKTDFATGSAPRVVSVGDFNGDGNQDLAVANRSSNNVSILLGDGAGSFGAKTDFATGNFPLSVSVGDLNRDGNQDLAVANFLSNNVSILLGDGAGSFGAKTDFEAGTNPYSVSVGDFNRDGNQDLAVANASSDDVSILLGDGSGSFGVKTDFGTGDFPVSVSVGDFNGDGNQDLAVANSGSSSVSILLGDGTGGFGAKTDFEAGTLPYFVSVGDLNGDGQQDLAVANFASNNVSILLGDGAGGFGAKTDFETGLGPYSVTIGDFNGDKKQDLAVANLSSNNNSISILLGLAAVTGVTLEDENFIYDGTEKSIEITGTLPAGTSLVYTNNTRTNAGTQEATATISGPGFADLALTADLTITPAPLQVTALNQSKAFGSALTLDTDKVTITGFVAAEDETVLNGVLNINSVSGIAASPTAVVGTYVDEIVLSGLTSNNYEINFINGDLVVAPAAIAGITFDDESFVFDGTEKSLLITGTLPAGTSVNYANNKRVNVGGQQATATISGSNFTDLILTADLTITPADVAGITFVGGSFVYDGTAKSLAIAGTLPAGTSVAYTNNSRTIVGTQEITATITGANYTTLVLTTDLTITPATVTGITLADGSFTYDGTAKSLEITGTLPEGTSVAYTNNGRTNVGTQEVTATITGANFTTLELKADLTITPADITGITFADGSFVYDGTAKSLVITGTLPAGTSVAYTNNSRTIVGTQEITATITGANYTTLVLTTDLTITPATVTGITLADGSFTYDGTAKSLVIEGTLPEGTSVAYTNNGRTNVGTQEVTATITGANFTTLELKADLTITPADITGITFADGSFVYDGTAKSLVITGTLPAGTSVAYTNNSRTNVGAQEITVTITGANYTTLVLTADLTITPADITGITLADGSFVFDGTAKSLVITGTLPAGTSVAYSNNGRTNAGTQEVTATITGANYTTLVLTADLTITPADITGITFADGSFVFDGTAKSLAIAGTLPAGTSVAYSNNGRTNVGTQEVTATITGANFTTLELKADLEITPADITGITFADGSFVFDGTAKSLVIAGTLPAGTSVAYSNNGRTNAGTQEVTATITGANFTTLELKADLEITPADITGITFADGSFVFDGTAKSLVIAGTLPAGTSVAYSNNGRTNAGTQEVTATVTGANFTTMVLTADLTITPAVLTVTTDPNQSKLFGQADPVLTFTAAGYGAGDDASIFSGSLAREAGEAVGFYAISQGSLGAGMNYTISFTGATFEIITNDSDGDGVPDDVEIEEGTDPNDPSDFKDSDGDGVPDFVEEQEGTDPNDPTDFKDSDNNGVPDYVEIREGTDPNDSADFKDSDGDGVPDYVQDRSILNFVPQVITVAWGTPEAALGLSTEVIGVTGKGEFINVPVTWDLTGYNPLIAGTNNFTGVTSLPEGILNTYSIDPVLAITIEAKPAPQDITLSANSFIAIPDVFFQDIGVFTVTDPTDNIHEISLIDGAADNQYFEIIDGILFWSSAEQASGRTQFTINVRVTDRAGNVLEKSFQITRNRTPLSELEVPNSFTPNNDGVNDTWGVPALRYYQGVRIEVFEVGSSNRIFYTEDPDVRWNGRINGNEPVVTAYLWVITVGETGEVRRGMLNLLKQ